MLYKGKAIEIIGTKEVFGEKVAWIRILEDDTFQQVAFEELDSGALAYSMAHIRFIALAAKIKDEVAKKNILAPYESSLLPLPHQILVLEKVMQSSQNRFLLADEVGMGKTIEAGLILKELKLRGNIKRILTIVPKSAMLQWQSELKEHFNEVFHVYDSEMISSLARTFSNINADQEFNFWEQHNQIIVSTDALKPLEKRQGWSGEKVDEYNKYRIEAVLNANFDLVIIDEAHKMGGASQTVSRFLLAQALCNSVPNVLLLTATPHRGKSDHFRRILQLLDPDAFDGEGLPDISELEPYVIRTEKRLAVDYEGKKLFNERKTIKLNVDLDPYRHQKQIALYRDVTDYVIKGFRTAGNSGNSAVGLIMILFQRLVSSSTAAILSAMQGRFERLNEADDNIEDYSNEIDSGAEEFIDSIDLNDLRISAGEGIEEEEEILSKLIQQAKDCLNTETDAKAEAFIEKYNQLQQEFNNKDLKVIVFTEYRASQQMLIDLFEIKGYRCEMINGSLSLEDRKIALGNFKNTAQILIATDAAGESLNMQFSHIVFNYDLPWNPMMIEQRIGRVDRIGQKHQVQAYNMLTNNSVDLRVYQIIVEKLNQILKQLGIDKTSDVLDSTMETKKINQLYLQSLLDPASFEFEGEKWLHEIKSKLRNYQSTEGVLPEVKEEEIEYKKAADIKHSPLSIWLENLIVQYTKIHKGYIQRNLLGYYDIELEQQSRKITFDSEVSLNYPTVENITLQNDLIKKVLSDMGEFSSANGIPVLQSKSNDETPGVWSIWEISAHHQMVEKVSYHSYFIADNGKMYEAYANDLWNRFVTGDMDFSMSSTNNINDSLDEETTLKSALYLVFQKLETDIQSTIQTKKDNKIKSYEFQKSRIQKIGIKNIRKSKFDQLEKEHEAWLNEFNSNKKIIPNIKHLLSVRIDG